LFFAVLVCLPDMLTNHHGVLPFWLAEFSILTKAKKGLDVRMHEQQSA